MSEQEFISEIKSALSAACAIPVGIRDAEIKRIIKQSAKWFYRNYEDATEERFYAIPVDCFDTEAFRKKRTVLMPSCVISVFSLKKLRDNFGFSSSFDGTSNDLTLERVLFSNSSQIGNNSENLMYYTMNLYWLDTMSHVLNHTIGFNYNRNSKKLFFAGETPDRDCIASCIVELPIENLYDDETFFRYVEARSKIQISNVLGTFDFKLPGGISINYDLIRSEGQEAYQEIKEEIKGDNAMDFFFTSGGG